ncbi:MAG: hypothetical protein RID15_10025 [Marinovum algicola]|uniref:hypothetical protein n=1 Tax=Marinovum algicola TaxID=42444 RepID=UPI0032EBDDB9
MPLQILLPMVVIGIAGIVVLLHVLGRSELARFEDEDAARQAWLREYPDTPPTRVILSHDNHAALVETEYGAGVVWPMGMDTTARLLRGAAICRTKDGLLVDLPDFAAPRVRLRLNDDEADLWPALMNRNDSP